MNNNEIVSVVVVAFNSAKYIYDTLESVRMQTHKNIDLIISDDCSIDNTVQICEKWLKENSQRFISCILLTSQYNSGIPANCNRGLRAARGEWIKFLAGDDILDINYLSHTLNYAKIEVANLIFTKITPFADQNDSLKMKDELEYIKNFLDSNYHLYKGNQLKNILKKNFIPAPSVLMKRELLLSIGFDERFSIEDLPLWTYLIGQGHRFAFLNESLVKYRIHPNSAYNKNKARDKSLLIDPGNHSLNKKMFIYIRSGIYFKKIMLFKLYDEFISIFFCDIIIRLSNRHNFLNSVLYAIMLIFRPWKIIEKIHKRANISKKEVFISFC